MVGVRSSKVNMLSEMVAAVVAVLAAVAVAVVARPVKLKDSTCSTADEYVYPYPSVCATPAELGGAYHYVESTFLLGGMEPEYDESNSTYYVRFTGNSSDAGSTYSPLQLISASQTLLVNSTFYVKSFDRVLQWRLEGEDEFFLIEKEVESFTEGALFRLVEAKDVTLTCPTAYNLQCHAYFLVSDIAPDYTGAGLLAYQEDNVTYIKAAKASSTGDLPIVLTVASYTTSLSSALPFPTTIRTVTQ